MRSKDRNIKDAIKSYIEAVAERGGNCPAYRHIASALGISASTVYRYIVELERDGEIFLGEFGYETAARRERAGDGVSVPVLGYVPCGPLEEETEAIDGYLNLPQAMLGRGEFFILRASGDSMVGAGIDDGDLVIIKRQEYAYDGDIVVALVDNEVTLKRFFRDDAARRVILHPENAEYSDITVADCVVQGVAVKIIKDVRHG